MLLPETSAAGPSTEEKDTDNELDVFKGFQKPRVPEPRTFLRPETASSSKGRMRPPEPEGMSPSETRGAESSSSARTPWHSAQEVPKERDEWYRKRGARGRTRRNYSHRSDTRGLGREPIEKRNRDLRTTVTSRMRKRRRENPEEDEPKEGEEREEPEEHGYDLDQMSLSGDPEWSSESPEEREAEESGDLGMFEVIGENEKIRGIVPIRASLSQTCRICKKAITEGNYIVKAQKHGWIHAHCCRTNLDSLRLDRVGHKGTGKASRDKTVPPLPKPAKIPAPVPEGDDMPNLVGSSSEEEPASRKYGTAACIGIMAMMITALSVMETPKVLAASSAGLEAVDMNASNETCECFIEEVKIAEDRSDLRQLTHGTIGVLALVLGLKLWRYLKKARSSQAAVEGQESDTDSEWSRVDDEAVQMVEEEDEDDVAVAAVEPYGSWTRFNYDTGAAISVFPKRNLPAEAVRALRTNGKKYRSACGKSIPDLGGVRITGEAEDGCPRAISTRVADVHKPLISASSTAGHLNAWISKKGQGGYLIPAASKTAKKVQRLLDSAALDPAESIMQLYEEQGTYNFYLDTSKGDISSVSLEAEAQKLTRKELEEAYARGPPGQPKRA
jgi:hypothetical protein